MTTDEKVDLILNFLRYNFLVTDAVGKKEASVRKQDFETATHFRKEEVQLREELSKYGKELIVLLNSEQNAQECDATDDESSTKDGKQNKAG